MATKVCQNFLYCDSSLVQFSKFNNFLWVCWFLGKNLSNFVSPVWKLHNPYCHSLGICLRFVFCYNSTVKAKVVQPLYEKRLIYFTDILHCCTFQKLYPKLAGKFLFIKYWQKIFRKFNFLVIGKLFKLSSTFNLMSPQSNLSNQKVLNAWKINVLQVKVSTGRDVPLYVPLSHCPGTKKFLSLCPGTKSSVPGRPGTKWISKFQKKFGHQFPVLEHPFPVLEKRFLF